MWSENVIYSLSVRKMSQQEVSEISQTGMSWDIITSYMQFQWVTSSEMNFPIGNVFV